MSRGRRRQKTAKRLSRPPHGYSVNTASTASGLDAIMESAGLTDGGFYRHFRSKNDLAAEAVAHGLADSAGRLAALPSLKALVSGYLSPEHRANRENGCMIAALGSDMTRQGKGVRRALTADVRAQIDRLAGWTDGPNAAARRRRAVATLAGMVGALILARAVEDPALSQMSILAAGRTVCSAAECRRTERESKRDWGRPVACRPRCHET